MAASDSAFADAKIDARWVYAIEPEGRGPDAETLARAALLLNAEGVVRDSCFVVRDGLAHEPRTANREPRTTNREPRTANHVFFVTPRKGTISPWSSKATDIFRNCGLKGIARVERGIRFNVSPAVPPVALGALYDRMTEGVYTDLDDLFDCPPPKPGVTFDVLGRGVEAIREANVSLGLAISEPEMQYLAESFTAAGRNPTDTELVMFGQVNSEHCRHKIFGAQFIIDGKKQKDSLFGMIKNTHKKNGTGTLVAYKDNSSVVEGFATEMFDVVRDSSSVVRDGLAHEPRTTNREPRTTNHVYKFRKVHPIS